MATSEEIEKMSMSELLDDAIDMLTGTLIYMAHIRRYYPKVHNKAVVSKRFLKHEGRNNGSK